MFQQVALLDVTSTNQDVLNALKDLKTVTAQLENILEEDKLTDLEVSSLIASVESKASLLSLSLFFSNNETKNVSIKNKIKNIHSC